LNQAVLVEPDLAERKQYSGIEPSLD